MRTRNVKYYKKSQIWLYSQYKEIHSSCMNIFNGKLVNKKDETGMRI